LTRLTQFQVIPQLSLGSMRMKLNARLSTGIKSHKR
jgi:hypothetical protein